MKVINLKISICFMIMVLLFLNPFISSINAQQRVGQIWRCNTADNLTSATINTISLESTTAIDTSLKIINVFFHIIRRNDGSGGLTNDQVNNWLVTICNDYSVHKILIRETGRSGLNNTTFFTGMTDNNYSSLISTNTHSDAIDIYLLSPTDTYSRASGIPGIALAVGGAYQGTSVLSHEFGHCLGLYHTHSGRGCSDFMNCSENIDGSNCSTCGDLICDTPADPCLAGNVDVNCNYIGDPSFAPDVHNMMSYAPPACLSNITLGQKLRIHASILSNTTLFDTRSSKPYISGNSLICSAGRYYTVNDVPTGFTVSWNKSTNITLPSNTTTNPILATPNGSASGWMQATVISSICGSVTLEQYIVWVGTPVVSVTGPDEGYPNIEYAFQAHTDDPEHTDPFSYTWDMYPYDGYISTSQGGNYAAYGYFTFYDVYSASGYRVMARAENDCGTGAYGETRIWIHDYWKLSPNPASDIVTITRVGSDENNTTVINSDGKNATCEIQIIDYNGSLHLQTTKSGDSFTLPVSNLKDGTYFVKISNGKKTSSLKLVVKH